jgi:Fe-S-cluster containining protein
MPGAASAPLARYGELVARVDAFFARVQARHGAAMRCGAGCDGCCRAQPRLGPTEAAAMRCFVGSLSPGALAALRRRAVADLPNRCVALDEDGRCAIYPARPLICRAHGLPLRRRAGDGRPFVVACRDNFPAGLPGAEDTLDLSAIEAELETLDHPLDAAASLAPGPPLPLRELLLGLDL